MNIVCTWADPNVDVSRSGEFAGVVIEVRRDPSFDWTEQGLAAPGDERFVIADVSAGPWFIRARSFTRDGDGNPLYTNEPVEATVDVPLEAPPGVVDFLAELE